ncbi:hypothetical protein [Saccharothrix xinjiangensis]|uniref:Glycosyl hydrolase family 31 C-terminal domain-containing protein n=1 Tax=Saccharothrix xinjiangensis TaxID=204798 RepID=A0ABV9XUQ4_9PSEU
MGSREVGGGFGRCDGHRVARAGAWGPDPVRVRVGLAGVRDDVPGARSSTANGDGCHRTARNSRACGWPFGSGRRRPGLVLVTELGPPLPTPDRFPFGPDLLVAPVHRLGRRSREVHLPSGARWTDTATGALHEGGQTLPVDAPLDRTPLFTREGARLPGFDAKGRS